MYLSRLILNPRNQRVRSELAQPYELHRSIMRAFPDDIAPGAERVLFRIDEHPELGLVLLVQSLGPPDWMRMLDCVGSNYLVPVPDNPAVKELALNLSAGQRLKFRLLANPTVKRKRAVDNKPVRQGLVDEKEQRAWLERKAIAGGIRLLSFDVSPYRLMTAGTKEEGEIAHSLNLLAVRFDGALQVTDPAVFVQTVENGIGSAKGLGFGLLSLAPPG